MILQALLLAAAIGWLFWKGYLGPAALSKLAMAAAAGLVVWLSARGQYGAAAIFGGLFAALVLRQRRRRRVAALGADEAEARLLLGVGLRAGRAEILSAHRRRIAAVHPDRIGRDSDLASRVNAARDLLLARLPADAP